MLTRGQIERAVDLQTRGYQLVLWLETALEKGFIAPWAVHEAGTLEAAAHAWISDHYLNFPERARPAPDDVLAFSRLFSTYLSSTFDLDANPGMQLVSPYCHCYCPLCSWLVRAPHIRPKKVRTADKKVAERMKRGFVRALSLDVGTGQDDTLIDQLLGDPELREIVGLCTYASDLLRRLEGESVGAATLALWRSFAWTAQGSPKKGFKLSADAVMDAQERLKARLVALAAS